MSRGLLFAALAAALMIPHVVPPGTPPPASPAVMALAERIDALRPLAVVLVSFDFDAASAPELAPQAKALLRHLFQRHLRVIAVGQVPTGRALARRLLLEAAEATRKREGEDFVDLGWRPGGPALILAMGEDLRKAFPEDVRGIPSEALPCLRDVRILADARLIISFAQRDADAEAWLTYARRGHPIEIGAGTTAAGGPALAPFLKSGQLVGLITGLQGAAEYEGLLKTPGDGTRGLGAVTTGCRTLAVLVVLANLLAWRAKGRRP